MKIRQVHPSVWPGSERSSLRTAGTRIDSFVIRRIVAGWHPDAIALVGNVSKRTAYRWQADLDGLQEIVLGGYVATFALRKSKPPVRVSAWRPTLRTIPA